jgi:hypothetical protein
MSEETMVEVELYGYKNQESVLLWTPNLEFAKIQMRKYGTEKIYVETNKN